jgi:peptidoglycan/LPS O-acetylase OafA/YrhL
MNFRYDINGLRAIAVIAVVLFHFNPAWVPGGFAGVDVFFVISGFLMTGIILRGLENDNFNLFNFYVDRSNRIIPALAILCLVVIVFSYFYINVLDQLDIHRHVNGSMWFFSNFLYWRESGYFDAASHEKWLLHTWSLSVEWQFYVIYPIVLVVLKKLLSLENLKRLIVIGTILGFALSFVATMKWPNPAYYLLPTRAWEMMMGGVAFLYPWCLSESKKKLIELIGLALIFVSYAFVSSDVPWPGHFALIPVIGAYLVIIANQQSSLVTNNKAFQYLGKCSYSIYLWHWPVVVFGVYFSISHWYLVGVPLSVLLGWLSYRFIENANSTNLESFMDIFKFKPLIYSFAVLSVSYVASVTNGFNDLPADYKLSKQDFRNKYEGHLGLYGKGRDPVFLNSDLSDFDVVLIGDSYARHFYSYFKNSEMKVASLAVDGCYSTRDFFSKSDGLCKFRYQDEVDFLRKHPNKSVIISRNWGKNGERFVFSRESNDKALIDGQAMLKQLNDLIGVASESGHKVYVVGNNQGADIIPFKTVADLLLSGESVTDLKEPLKSNLMGQMLKDNKSNLNYTFLDVSESLCESSSCFTVSDGQVIYTDKGHFSKFGAGFVGRTLFKNIGN